MVCSKTTPRVPATIPSVPKTAGRVAATTSIVATTTSIRPTTTTIRPNQRLIRQIVLDLLLIAKDQHDLRENGATDVERLSLAAHQLQLLKDLEAFQRRLHGN